MRNSRNIWKSIRKAKSRHIKFDSHISIIRQVFDVAKCIFFWVYLAKETIREWNGMYYIDIEY